MAGILERRGKMEGLVLCHGDIGPPLSCPGVLLIACVVQLFEMGSWGLASGTCWVSKIKGQSPQAGV